MARMPGRQQQPWLCSVEETTVRNTVKSVGRCALRCIGLFSSIPGVDPGETLSFSFCLHFCINSQCLLFWLMSDLFIFWHLLLSSPSIMVSPPLPRRSFKTSLLLNCRCLPLYRPNVVSLFKEHKICICRQVASGVEDWQIEFQVKIWKG